jgi:integrase
MKLTDTRIKSAKPSTKAVKLSDGRGLYLLINTSGTKLWRLKYRVDGREKLMSFGAYPEVSLAQAREACDQARKQLAAGADPMALRKSDKQSRLQAADNSFAAVARAWWLHWKPARSPRHAEYVIRRLEADVFPEIGSRSISGLEAPDLVRMVKAIEARGVLDIAKRALQTTGQVFRYAVAHGHATRNPATDIKPTDVLKPRKRSNFARIDAKELPDLMRKIEGYAGAATTRLALKLMALTFVRTSELIGARWSEFDLEAERWDIPAERMKMRTPHIVPLSRQAIEVLQVLKTITGGRELLFPGERDHSKSMSNNTILAALARMGYKHRMTGHGFRGLASTILHEQDFDHHHIELQLAHMERNAVSAAYNHALYLGQRARLMQHWADYLEGCTRANVVVGAFRKVA